jgi:hypothetical protein
VAERYALGAPLRQLDVRNIYNNPVYVDVRTVMYVRTYLVSPPLSHHTRIYLRHLNNSPFRTPSDTTFL